MKGTIYVIVRSHRKWHYDICDDDPSDAWLSSKPPEKRDDWISISVSGRKLVSWKCRGLW